MSVRQPDENSNERMTDRPRLEEPEIPVWPLEDDDAEPLISSDLAVDDTVSQPLPPASEINDV